MFHTVRDPVSVTSRKMQFAAILIIIAALLTAGAVVSQSEDSDATDIVSGIAYDIVDGKAVIVKDDAHHSLTGTLTIPATVNINSVYYNVTEIADEAFSGCTGITELKFATSSKLTKIGMGSFYGCTGLTGSITFPEGLKTIGDMAFQDSGSSVGISTITISSTVSYIGDEAFLECKCKKFSVSGGSTYSVYNDVLYNKSYETLISCPTLLSKTNLIIHTNTKTISDGAFTGCTKILKNLAIPDSVEYIGERAFAGCTGISQFSLGKSIITISDYAFTRCSNASFANMIPASVTYIGTYAFSDCNSNTSTLNLKEGLLTIGDYAFDGNKKMLGAFSLPDSLNSIGRYAFRNCQSLSVNVNKTLTIGDNVTYLGNGAFYGCSLFKGSLVIDCSLDTIKEEMFSGCGFTRNLTIGNKITKIGDFAFGTMSFETVTIGSSVTSIGKAAFGSCYHINKITFTSAAIPTIGEKAFGLGTQTNSTTCNVIASYADGFLDTYGNNYTVFVYGDGIPYDITYDIAGGSMAAPTETPHIEGKTITIKYYSGSKEGYTFGGWTYLGVTYQGGDPFTMPADNVTFVAKWILIPSYSVVYDLNGGHGTTPTPERYYAGTKITISECDATYPGYIYKGWYIYGDETTIYQPGQTYKVGSSNVHFMAYWEWIPIYAVDFDVNGGNMVGPVVDDQHPGSIFIIPDYSGTKLGYDFLGWSYSGTTYQSGTPFTMPSNNVEFVAEWDDAVTPTEDEGFELSIEIIIVVVFIIALVAMMIVGLRPKKKNED